jgi:hypothetical protein
MLRTLKVVFSAQINVVQRDSGRNTAFFALGGPRRHDSFSLTTGQASRRVNERRDLKSTSENKPYIPCWAAERPRQLPPPLPKWKTGERFGRVEWVLFCVAMLMTAISLYKLMG